MKKKLIRSGVFETNSSSSHSVSIADENKDFVLDMIYPNDEGIIVLFGGEFGWDWFKHNDALTKANYAAVAHQHNPDLVIEVIKEQTGADHVVFAFTSDYDGPNWSYIDHDSIGVCPSTKEELRNFIFNKNSWLFGGNNNTEHSPNFYDVPTFYKDGSVETARYTHELKVDGLTKVAKFKSKPTKDEIVEALSRLFDTVTLTPDGRFLSTNWSSSENYFRFDSERANLNLRKRTVNLVHNRLWYEAKCKYESMNKRSEDSFTFDKFVEIRKIEDEWVASGDKRYVREVKFSIREI